MLESQRHVVRRSAYSLKAVRSYFISTLPFWIIAFALCSIVGVSWWYYISEMNSPLEVLSANIESRVEDISSKFQALQMGYNLNLVNISTQSRLHSEITDLQSEVDTLLKGKAELSKQALGTTGHDKHTVLSGRRRFVSSSRSINQPDPIIDGLPKFNISTVKVPLTLEEATRFANESANAKGKWIGYYNHYKESGVTTEGQYFSYKHNYDDPCMVPYISMKYDPKCSDSETKSENIIQLLVVGTQRSGTHYTWEMLNRLGVHVHHEGVGPDGAIGWPYSVNALSYRPSPRAGTFSRLGYVINNPKRLSVQRFKFVFHQVRHPLRVIKTVVERCQAWDKFWKFIASVKGLDVINESQTPLTRAMLLYIYWNKHIERYADMRFQGEITSPRDVCRWSSFPEAKCDNSNPSQEIVEPVTAQIVKKNRRLSKTIEVGRPHAVNPSFRHPVRQPPTAPPNKYFYGNITWSLLDGENTSLANELRIMCIEYGYDLDPEIVPQAHETHAFTA